MLFHNLCKDRHYIHIGLTREVAIATLGTVDVVGGSVKEVFCV